MKCQRLHLNMMLHHDVGLRPQRQEIKGVTLRNDATLTSYLTLMQSCIIKILLCDPDPVCTCVQQLKCVNTPLQPTEQ